MSTTYTAIDSPLSGKSYTVMTGETTVGVVYKVDGTRVWGALPTGRKNVLKEQFATRTLAAQSLIDISAEKVRRRNERAIQRETAKSTTSSAIVNKTAELGEYTMEEIRATVYEAPVFTPATVRYTATPPKSTFTARVKRLFTRN